MAVAHRWSLVDQVADVGRSLRGSRLVLRSHQSVRLLEELVREGLNPRAKLCQDVGVEDLLQLTPRTRLLETRRFIDQGRDSDVGQAGTQNFGKRAATGFWFFVDRVAAGRGRYTSHKSGSISAL